MENDQIAFEVFDCYCTHHTQR